jgi:hypothetical protein
MDTRFDDLLHTIIVEKGQGIYGFFDVVFGFMYRRTDFMYEMAPGENMGFFPGQAEAIVYNYFRKYQNLHFKERVPKRNIDPKEVEEYLKKQKENKESAKPQKQIDQNESSKIEINPPEISSVKPSEKQLSSSEPSKLETKINTISSPEIKTDQKSSKVDTSISTYNGDSCDNYNWSQGVMDVTIQINLPPGTNKKMVYSQVKLFS